jgi:transcriptional regulator with XRE-family HTH domain
MTPFGQRLRRMRAERGILLKDMADALGVSPSYLSALEHGRRGVPTWALVQAVIAYFNIIWDEAEDLQRLADLSDPRVVVDTAGLSPAATLLANRLARDISLMSEARIAGLLALLDQPRQVRLPTLPDEAGPIVEGREP